MRMIGQDSLKTRRTLSVDGKTYHYFSLPEAAKSIGDLTRLPYSLKVLLENVLRFEDGRSYTVDDAKKIAEWVKDGRSDKEVPFRPGFHRRARRGGPCRHARCLAWPGW